MHGKNLTPIPSVCPNDGCYTEFTVMSGQLVECPCGQLHVPIAVSDFIEKTRYFKPVSACFKRSGIGNNLIHSSAKIGLCKLNPIRFNGDGSCAIDCKFGAPYIAECILSDKNELGNEIRQLINIYPVSRCKGYLLHGTSRPAISGIIKHGLLSASKMGWLAANNGPAIDQTMRYAGERRAAKGHASATSAVVLPIAYDGLIINSPS